MFDPRRCHKTKSKILDTTGSQRNGPAGLVLSRPKKKNVSFKISQKRAEPGTTDKRGRPLDPARTAFEEAKSVFASALTRDPEKVRLVESANDLDGFFQLVKQREKAYQNSRGAGKVRKWLAAVSSRIAFYGSIMDVLFQQSPAWVSLAWGAIELVFVGVENHENLLRTFATAICRIGAALPRLERSLVLFPTPEIISGATNLYAQIMRFLTRPMPDEGEAVLARDTYHEWLKLDYSNLYRLNQNKDSADREIYRREKTPTSSIKDRIPAPKPLS
ncbi:hypothetical protein PV04_07729 [Phialophora macrospora]|uniref:DUF7708 domain-containing protein n=1 Tax=Phialophora macrospora TaxID=1851006 RepID=A0A0D2CJR1_9EURO|nr:hypothetical protein PV04_07729 [Phialophora macrospora]